MTSAHASSDVSRRVMLATAAPLPTLCGSTLLISEQAQTDPLPSWNDGPSKWAIFDSAARVTRQAGPDFVPTAQRIATFDHDATLWVEHASVLPPGLWDRNCTLQTTCRSLPVCSRSRRSRVTVERFDRGVKLSGSRSVSSLVSVSEEIDWPDHEPAASEVPKAGGNSEP